MKGAESYKMGFIVNCIGLQMKVDQIWNLTKDTFVRKPALHLIRKPIFISS